MTCLHIVWTWLTFCFSIKHENLICSVRFSSQGNLTLGNVSVSMALLHICSFSSLLRGGSRDKWVRVALLNELAELLFTTKVYLAVHKSSPYFSSAFLKPTTHPIRPSLCFYKFSFADEYSSVTEHHTHIHKHKLSLTKPGSKESY